MWGGRFAAGPAELMQRINASHPFDRKLWRQDLRQSRAHAVMLAKQGLITDTDQRAILDGLTQIEAEIASDSFTWSDALEDIHMHVEHRLGELAGSAGKRLHTARSRNDQVATSMRLWTRDMLDAFDGGLAALQTALLDHAEQHAATVMPGFTHLQPAQPVTLGHHLLAYVEMFERDRGRGADARERLNECPLGAAALAGTPLPIDRDQTAAALGFRGPMRNSIDAVSDRDFILEVLATAVITATHLSRLAEELVLWSTPAFGFVTLPDAFSTGSSIMPQKRNPDAAELVRGKSGRVLGAFVAIATVLKALPLAYAKDLQEDKEPMFDACETLDIAMTALAGMVRALTFNPEPMRAMAEVGHPTATDLADWLVSETGMPFREAHSAAGQAVRRAEERKCRLAELTLADLQAIVPAATEETRQALGVDTSLSRRNSIGGAAPERVRAAVAEARERLQ